MTATTDFPSRNAFAAACCVVAVAIVCGCGSEPRSRTASVDPGSREAAWVSCAGKRPAPDAYRQIDRRLAEAREAHAVPGMAVAIVCGDTLAFAKGYGVRAVDDPTPVTARTRFRIASVTKVFTATAIMKLEESGALRRDDPVRDHLPWFELARPAVTGSAPVTIQHLLTHTAGMPRDSRLTDFGRRFQPERGAAVAALPDQRLESGPGERHAYSNLGYAVLGELIARKAGVSYAEYLRREILEPLGMRETLVHPGREDVIARGHGPRRPDGSRPVAGFWELRFATPAGGMASSVVELSEFVVLQLARIWATSRRCCPLRRSGRCTGSSSPWIRPAGAPGSGGESRSHGVNTSSITVASYRSRPRSCSST